MSLINSSVVRIRHLPRRRRIAALATRAGVVGVVSVGALLGFAGIASAHVTANPGTAAQGSYAKIAFRVPNEEDAAATVKLEVNFPTDHPIASVSTEPLPGWTATVDKTNLATPIKTDDGEVTQAVSKITWTGGQIAPGQFQDFNVSLGPLPDNTTELVFKALQTYSNGTVVRWIDLTPPGGPEPEHPAPTLHLTPAAVPGPATASHDGSASATAALALGILGAVLGSIGAVLGGLALRRRTASSHAAGSGGTQPGAGTPSGRP
jgi:uncharacterized protein YcnI